MKKIFLVFTLFSCAGVHLNPGAEKIIVLSTSEQSVVKTCTRLDYIVATTYISVNRSLNLLKNKAHKMNGTHLVIDKLSTAYGADVTATVYSCKK